MTATTEQLAPWQRIFRDGLAPELSDDGLLALLAALETDDPRLIQKRTTQSLAPWAEPDLPVCAACVIGFAGWHGEGLGTVGQVESYLLRTFRAAEDRLKLPPSEDGHATYAFLDWIDKTDRAEMRKALIPEVCAELARRREERAA